jgi:hypothetical protein
MAAMWTGLVVASVVITTSAAVPIAQHSQVRRKQLVNSGSRMDATASTSTDSKKAKQVPRKQLVNSGSRMDATASTSTDSKKSTSGVDEDVARRAAQVSEWTEMANTRCHNDIGQTHNITSMTGATTRQAVPTHT